MPAPGNGHVQILAEMERIGAAIMAQPGRRGGLEEQVNDLRLGQESLAKRVEELFAERYRAEGAGLARRVDAHDERIKALELFRARMWILPAAVGSVCGAVVATLFRAFS